MRLSAEEVSSIAEGGGFARASARRMTRRFEVRGTFSGGDAGNPVCLSGSLWGRPRRSILLRIEGWIEALPARWSRGGAGLADAGETAS